MSRTKPLLSHKEYVPTRTFSKYVGNSYYPSKVILMDPEADDFYKAELNIVPLTNRSWGQQSRDYSSANLHAINAKFLKKFRPNLSSSLVTLLVSNSYEPDLTEAKVASAFMMNEFLAQDEFEVYHDFLNANWDDLLERSVTFQINQYPHTLDVYKHYHADSPFTFRPKHTKKQRMVLENFTKDQLFTILTNSKREHVASNGVTIYLTNKLKELDGKIERQMSIQEATNQLMRAFSVSLLAGGYHSNLRLTEVFGAITEIVQGVNARTARDSVNYGANQITPNDLGKIGTFLEENGAEFTIAEMFFVIYSLHHNKLFARTGTTADIVEVYLQFLEKENALELFKMVGELAQAYSKQLPTITQWRKALAAGDLDFVMESEITAVLVAASDVPATPIGEVVHRRKLFGGGIA
jgi:hypothetical protein